MPPAMVDAPRIIGLLPATGIFGVCGVGDGPSVGELAGVFVGPKPNDFLHTSGTDENVKLLSRTRHEKL